MCDQETIRTLYKKLLALYPRAFRDQLGESMEQTFQDLCNERKRRTERGFFSYVLWMFVETASGIIKERVLQMTNRNAMRQTAATFGLAAIISFVLILPFALLEVVNNTIPRAEAPGILLLFGVLWLLPTVFFFVLIPIVRNVRAGNSILANPMILLLRVASLVLIGSVWIWGFMDQLPCFLGVPNCD